VEAAIAGGGAPAAGGGGAARRAHAALPIDPAGPLGSNEGLVQNAIAGPPRPLDATEPRMVYKTLHWYIVRELLRIFLLTAAALTTLLAFGGTFKPLTKHGLDITQLMLVLLNLMPAMLAYAIPLAALFAAVLVYWRMATDNELTACRAGGISFATLTVPALVLGMAVASADLVFVNYVVPVFLQRTESLVRRDLASLLYQKIGRQEPFEYSDGDQDMIVYADSASLQETPAAQLPPGIDQRTTVHLNGVAAALVGTDGQPRQIVVARAADVVFDQKYHRDEVYIDVRLDTGAAYDGQTMGRVSGSGSVRSLSPDGKPVLVKSLLKEKPKFLNFIQLQEMDENPVAWDPKIAGQLAAIRQTWKEQQLAARLAAQWKPNQPLSFKLGDDGLAAVTAPRAELSPEKALIFHGQGTQRVRTDVYRGQQLAYYFLADRAELQLRDEQVVGQPLRTVGQLSLTGNIIRVGVLREVPATHVGEEYVLAALEIPPSMVEAIGRFPEEELRAHPQDFSRALQQQLYELRRSIADLAQQIGSELNSRASFALACLTLVLLGAALGILMRGKNPLLVFVVGFVPAIVLVLLITAGRRMVENAEPGHTLPGLATIWAGNVLLLLLVTGVYAKLLRH
jgi:lipopolysaccharide export LptBFGC system permease protein LptF